MARLDLLESREACLGLMTSYMAATDAETGKGEKVAALFTDDGQWESIGPNGNPAGPPRGTRP